MTKPSREVSELIEALEDQAAIINQMLDYLRVALANAQRDSNFETARALDSEIAYYIRRLAEVQKKRANLRQKFTYIKEDSCET